MTTIHTCPNSKQSQMIDSKIEIFGWKARKHCGKERKFTPFPTMFSARLKSIAQFEHNEMTLLSANAYDLEKASFFI